RVFRGRRRRLRGLLRAGPDLRRLVRGLLRAGPGLRRLVRGLLRAGAGLRRLVRGLLRAVARLLRGRPGLLRVGPGPRLVGAGVPYVSAGVGAARLVRPGVELPRRPGQLLAQRAHRVPDVLGDLAGDVADRGGDLFFKLREVVEAGPQFLASLLGDAVDLPAVGLVVGYQALFFEPGQPRVDGPRRGRVDAHEP